MSGAAKIALGAFVGTFATVATSALVLIAINTTTYTARISTKGVAIVLVVAACIGFIGGAMFGDAASPHDG